MSFQKGLQSCALAEPCDPWRLTLVLGRLENLCFFIQIICWAHWISQVQSTGLPSIFLRAQSWMKSHHADLTIAYKHWVYTSWKLIWEEWLITE